MALAWPDFSEATITDAAAFDALWRAAAERSAAAAATGSSERMPDMNNALYYAAATPDRSRLITLRNALRGLAPKFVRMVDDRYAWQAWSRFPIAYEADDLLQGEHSLATLPARGSPEGDSGQLDVYRTYLSNCAWWIKQFRYVNVAAKSYWTRCCTAKGSFYLADYYGGEDHSERGAEPETFMSAPEIETFDQRHPVNATHDMIDCVHADRMSISDWFDDDEDQWNYDWSRSEYRSVDATAYSGLVVRNFAGLAGTLLLVPCYTLSASGAYPTRSIETEFVESVIPVWPEDDNGDRYYGDLVHVSATSQKHAATWLETARAVENFHNEWVQEGGGHRLDRTHTRLFTRTNWSIDGSRNHTETTSESDSGSGGGGALLEDSSLHVMDFDGFGAWTLGCPVTKGVIQSHARMIALPEQSAIPLPDVWNLTPYRQWRQNLHPRDRIDEVSFRSRLRIAPIIDFNDSYLYQATENQT